MLRRVDSELWARVKARAALDRVSLQGLIVWLLTVYVKRGLTAFEAIDGKFPR
jgi:hypothetical protein